ncbi:MAG: hypothetical protein LBH15_00875 [Treponema sp.]|jgi:hypothetical protein|nr:hypothetical protein [Treponema sp.]
MPKKEKNSVSVLFTNGFVVASDEKSTLFFRDFANQTVALAYVPEKDETQIALLDRLITFYPQGEGYAFTEHTLKDIARAKEAARKK